MTSSSLVSSHPITNWGLHCYERRKASERERKRRPSLEGERGQATKKNSVGSGARSSGSASLTKAHTDAVGKGVLEPFRHCEGARRPEIADDESGDECARRPDIADDESGDECARRPDIADDESFRPTIESDSEPDDTLSPTLEPLINRTFAGDEWQFCLSLANQKIKDELANVKEQQDQARATLRGLLGLPGAPSGETEMGGLRERNEQLEALVTEQQRRGDELENQLEETRSLCDMFQKNMFRCIEDGEAAHEKSENASRQTAQVLASKLTEAENKVVLLDAANNMTMLNSIQSKTETVALRKHVQEQEKEIEELKQRLSIGST